MWQLAPEDENDLDKVLPVDGAVITSKQPWLLYAMPVNALNFCSFAMCYDGMPQPSSTNNVEGTDAVKPILFAVPNAIDSGGVGLKSFDLYVPICSMFVDRHISAAVSQESGDDKCR